MKAAVDEIAIVIRDAIRRDEKMEWEWLYDFHTAGDILGMTSRQLVSFMREEGFQIYRNKYNNYKFVTAPQIKQIREMVLERVPIKGRFAHGDQKPPTKVSRRVPQEEGHPVQSSGDIPTGRSGPSPKSIHY